MKRILFFLTLLASIALLNRAQAQSCTISNISIDYKGSTSVNGNCQLTVDISFDLAHNNGFKYVWIHLWEQSSYPNPALTYSKPPTSAELANTVANIGLNYSIVNGVPQATLQTSYPGGSVIVTGTSVSISPGAGAGGTDRFKITGVVMTVPGACGSSVVIKGDDWGTNAQSQNSVQCFNRGIIFLANDPTIRANLVCNPLPRTIGLTISTMSTTPINVAYKLYKDDGDGIFEPGTNDILVADSTGPYTISSGSPYLKGGIGYTGNNVAGDHSNIWVSVTNSLTTNTQNQLITNSCASLPVHFLSFNAKRNNSSSVGLTWQTASESNNTGFSIERNINGSWMQVVFVPTQALGGNSQSVLSYSFTDQNSTSGMSQYRIKQIDIDGKSSYSEIRAVRGMGQSGKMIVYPNPTSNGTVNVVFQEVSASRDISITDMSGRTVQSWKAVTNNNLQINNLTPGLYALRVVDRGTGEQTVEKIVVDKR